MAEATVASASSSERLRACSRAIVLPACSRAIVCLVGAAGRVASMQEDLCCGDFSWRLAIGCGAANQLGAVPGSDLWLGLVLL